MIQLLLPSQDVSPKAIWSAVASVAFFLLNRWRAHRDKPKGVPTAPGHWLLGCLPMFLKACASKKQNELFESLHQTLGQTYALSAPGPRGVVVTRNPKNVEHILYHNFKNYPKGEIMRTIFHDLLGNGIFNADGQEWFHQRKTTSHMFTAKLFKEHIWVVVRRNAKKVRQVLQATKPGKSVDVFNLMNRFTLDTIGEIGFGKSIGSLEDPTSPFLKSFDRGQQVTFDRWFSLSYILKVSFLTLFLGLKPSWWSERRTQHDFATLDDYSRSVVRELQAAMSRDSTKAGGIAWADIEASKSFVGLFVQDARKKGQEPSEDFLRDLVLNFLIAGRDTTAQALSWTFYYLASHPEVEERARQEISEVCGMDDPAYDDIKSLPYLQAILSEALRLKPSVPIDVKLSAASDTWPDGTSISKDTIVCYNIYGMGRDPIVWGSDAEVFRPERWLDMKEPPSSYEYPVFNAGPRECLGKRLAMVEMKTCLAMLLPHMSLKLAVPAEDITADTQLTIGMASGLPCFVEKASMCEAACSDCASVASTAECTDYAASLSES